MRKKDWIKKEEVFLIFKVIESQIFIKTKPHSRARGAELKKLCLELEKEKELEHRNWDAIRQHILYMIRQFTGSVIISKG